MFLDYGARKARLPREVPTPRAFGNQVSWAFPKVSQERFGSRALKGREELFSWGAKVDKKDFFDLKQQIWICADKSENS